MSKDKLIEKIKKINYTYDIFLKNNEISELGNDRTLSGNSQYISYFNHLNDDEKELIDYYSLIQKEVFDEIFEIYLISEKEAKNLVKTYIKKIYVDKFFDDLELKKHELNFINKKDNQLLIKTTKNKTKTTKMDFPMTRFNYLIEPQTKASNQSKNKPVSFIQKIKQIMLRHKTTTTVERKLNLNLSKINEIKEAKVHGIDGKTIEPEKLSFELNNILSDLGYDENFNKKNKTLVRLNVPSSSVTNTTTAPIRKNFFNLPFIFRKTSKSISSGKNAKIYKKDTLKTLFKTSDKVINQYQDFKMKNKENVNSINDNNKNEVKEIYKNFFREIEKDLFHIFEDNFELGLITLKKMNDRNIHKYFIDYYKPINSLVLKKMSEMSDEEKLKDFILTHFYCTEIDSNQKKYKINIKYIDKILNNNGIKNKAYQFLEEDSKKNIAETLVIN